MTLSLKDLKAYSGILTVAFFSLALLIQPPPFERIPELVGLRQRGGLWSLFALIIAVFLSYVAVRVGWLFESMISNHDGSAIFALVFIAFGLSFLCKGRPEDPFPSLHEFWRFGSLAFGLTLLGVNDPDTTSAGKSTGENDVVRKQVPATPPSESWLFDTESRGSLHVAPPSWKNDENKNTSPPPSY